MTTPGCPTPQQLAALLGGRLSGDSETLLAAHLDSCERCRQWLERLAGDPRFLAEASASLRGAGETAPLPPADLVARWQELDSLPSGADGRGVNEERRETFASAPPARSGARVTREFYPEPAAGEFPRPGQRLGGYEIEKEVGRGGMGVVFLARDTSLERPVALKVLGAQWIGDDVARQRFLSEARAAAAVNHRHVVTIYAVVESGEWPFLVMEYVPGETLQHLIDVHSPLPLSSIVSIGLRVASGLAAAHAKGLIHRDVKPGNILVAPRTGVVKLTDFGLARVASDARITKDGLVVGTPAFMAPEQISGEPLDARADLYSLGGVLHAMCTGRPPIEAEHTLALIRRVLDAPRTPLAESCPRAPAWLCQLVDRLLARRPEDRVQSAQEVVEILRQRRDELNEESAPRAGGDSPGSSNDVADAPRADRAAATVAAALPARDETLVAPAAAIFSTVPAATAPRVAPVLAPPLSSVASRGGRGVVASRTRRRRSLVNALAIGAPLVALLAWGVWELLPTDHGQVADPAGARGAGFREGEASGRAARRPADANDVYVEILAANGERRVYRSLAAAVQAARVGETLVVHGTGLLPSEPIVIPQKALSIRAAPGSRPVVQFMPASQHRGFMLEADAPLHLEGLTLIVEGQNVAPAGPLAGGGRQPFGGGGLPSEGLIAFRNTTLSLKNCRLAAWRRGPALALERVAGCTLEGCQISGGEASAIVCRELVPEPGRRARLRLADSLVCGQSGVMLDVHHDALWELDLRRVNFVSDEALRLELPGGGVPPGVQPRSRVVAEECTFGGDVILSTWNHSQNEAPVARVEAARRLPSLVRWEARDNVYADGVTYFGLRPTLRASQFPRSRLIESLAEWRTFWSTGETGSREIALAYGEEGLKRDEALERALRRDGPAGDFAAAQLRAVHLPDENFLRPAR